RTRVMLMLPVVRASIEAFRQARSADLNRRTARPHLVCLIALLALIAGCSDSSDSSDDGRDSDVSDETEACPAPAFEEGDPVRAGFVHGGPVDDGGWDEAHHAGFEQVERTLGDGVEMTYEDEVSEG